MDFFSLVSRELYDRYNHVFPLSLKVVQNSGIDTTPDFHINVTNLNKKNDGKLFKDFYNGGYGGIGFKIDVIIGKDERWNGYLYNNAKMDWDVKNPLVTEILHSWIKNIVPLYVVTDAIDIPNGNYIITENSSRKQDYHDYTVWNLEFTEYNALNLASYKNNNSTVQKAIKRTVNAQKKKKTTKSASANNSKLGKCNLNTLKYSKTKKVVTCVKYMQNVLYKKGFLTKAQVDGWFGNVTVNALKKFQKKYQKAYKLSVNGKIDKNTLNALCKV